MNKKIFQAVFLSIIITMVLVLAVSIAVFYATYDERISRDLDSELSFLGEAVAVSPDDLGSFVIPGHRVTLISSDGAVLFDSDAEADEMENHLQRPEVQEAISYGHGSDRRRSSSQSNARKKGPRRRAQERIVFDEESFPSLASI